MRLMASLRPPARDEIEPAQVEEDEVEDARFEERTALESIFGEACFEEV